MITIEPRDPVIFRDARPFSAEPGARSRSQDFPPPSAVVGALRTRYGRAKGFRFTEEEVDAIRRLSIRGPILATLDSDQPELFFSAPRDMVLFGSSDPRRVVLHQLAPSETPKGSIHDLEGLVPLALVSPNSNKPFRSPPSFWRWERLLSWLTQAKDRDDVAVETLGLPGLPKESRTHVALSPNSQTAQEGGLFSTEGLRFQAKDQGRLKRFGLLVDSPVIESAGLDGLAPLGGERRLALWQTRKGLLPECPKEIREAVRKSGAARVVLLTPAIFSQGYRPTWLLDHASRPKLQAVAVGRPQVISGWDLQKGQAKPSRRAATAGSVYFITFENRYSGAIDKFLDDVWFQNISDDQQDRRDGFGLAAVGTWNGQLNPWKEAQK